MKKNILVVILMLFTMNANAETNVDENKWTGNVNVFLGQKSLDENDWAPLEHHAEGGVLVDFKKQNWPVSIAVDILGSVRMGTVVDTDPTVDLESYTSEIDVGVRKIWKVSGSSNRPRPYVGGGIAFVHGEILATNNATGFTVTEYDNGTGVWINGGVYWTLAQHFNLGLDLRYSKAEIKLYDVDVEAGGTHVGLLLGYHW